MASTPERVEELRRQAGWAQTFGLPLDFVSTADAHERFQGLFDPTDVLGAVWLPTDGWLNPSDLTMAPPVPAGGAEIATNTRVTGIGVEERNRRRWSRTSTPTGAASRVTSSNAGGIFAHEPAHAGVNVPVVAMAHQFAITRPRRTIPGDLPTMAHPDRLVYVREEVGGLIMGGYERNPDPWCVSGSVPADFNNRLLAPDWDRFFPLSEAAEALVPRLGDAEVHQLVNGPEAFTLDGEFILGESDVRGFFVAAGFCAHGIAGAGGNGQVMAEWIVGGEPPGDLWKMDIRRFGDQYRSRIRAARTYEVYSTYYDIVYPNHERLAGRPLRESPLYSRHEVRAARREERLGAGQPLHLERRRNARAPAAAAGPDSTGRRRSSPSTSRRATPPACSTSRASPRSRWRVRAPWRSCSTSA